MRKMNRILIVKSRDFKKFMYLFDAMGLSKYSIYFSMEMFPELLVEYGERSKDCDWDIGYFRYINICKTGRQI